MEPLDPLHTALLLIDAQRGFRDPVWGQRNNPHAERSMAALLAQWRLIGAPRFIVQHASRLPSSPLHPDAPGFALMAFATPKPDEPLIVKSVNSAFIGTDLEVRLRKGGIDTVVIAGLTTNHCCETTARMAGNLDFRVLFVADATATFDRTDRQGQPVSAEQIHEMTLTNLYGEFAEVVSSQDVLSAL